MQEGREGQLRLKLWSLRAQILLEELSCCSVQANEARARGLATQSPACPLPLAASPPDTSASCDLQTCIMYDEFLHLGPTLYLNLPQKAGRAAVLVTPALVQQASLLLEPGTFFSIPRYTTLCATLLYYTLLYSTLLYYTVLYSTLLYSTILYCTLLFFLYYTIPYHTIPYHTIPYHAVPYCCIVLGRPHTAPVFSRSAARSRTVNSRDQAWTS